VLGIEARSRLISGSMSSLWGVNTVARCSPKKSAFSLSLFAQLVSVRVCLRMGEWSVEVSLLT